MKFVLVAVVFAIAVYVLIRVIQRRGLQGPDGPAGGIRRPPPRPLGPDDDPDFLWGLDKRKRHPDKKKDDDSSGS